MKTCEKHSIHLGFTHEKFHEGTHICLIYNDDAERKKVISKYLESGLMDGEQVFYLADQISPRETREWLSAMDVELGDCIIDSAEAVYCAGGYFSADRMLENLKEYYQAGIRSGHSACRVSGEMSWALRGIPGSEELMEYESRVNLILPEYPITAVCQYDAGRFDGDTIYECLRVHPYMIVRNQIVRNPYYVQPEEYLGRSETI
jgi:MEDS: MEthanogen/methylotroph, DcmR Sensory domain